MSDPALAKLLAVDSDLEAQETKLLTQLETIQAQRTSLHIFMTSAGSCINFGTPFETCLEL